MKHYIEIENVGPIKKAKIDLSKYVVLIGPQASGKSIIAKLIAIFRSDEFHADKNITSLFEYFGVSTFISKDTIIKYSDNDFQSIYKNNKYENTISLNIASFFNHRIEPLSNNKPSIYIPAERIIISLLSQSIYSSIIQNKRNLPQLLLDFARKL